MNSDAIEPDSKDWTWVLTRPCPECRFVASDVVPSRFGAIVRGQIPRWRSALGRADARERPNPTTWSVLEYGAHVRDVNRIFAERLDAMLETDNPLFADWDQDAAAIENAYATLEPMPVAEALARAATALADRFDAVRPDQLERPGRRSNGSVFTVRTLGQYYLHDVVHHLHDVGA
ncbi:DinB family protein [Pengzhenrongella sp.]|jgi:hypothetical protein|uniref:DinB family protein n=1 Tax=Pengzhenrongella sp. TaxID=2888820 RepID=UPI002F92AD9F